MLVVCACSTTVVTRRARARPRKMVHETGSGKPGQWGCVLLPSTARLNTKPFAHGQVGTFAKSTYLADADDESVRLPPVRPPGST